MNYYDILGVSKDATKDDIKHAYRNMVKAFHPDYYHGDKEFAETKTRELNIAYEILQDDAKRKKYDDSIGIVRKDSVSYAFGDFYSTDEWKQRTGEGTHAGKTISLYDPDIFYPGYKETGKLFHDLNRVYTFPKGVEVIPADPPYRNIPESESYGIDSEDFDQTEAEYADLCEERLARMEEMKKEEKTYRKIDRMPASDVLSIILFGPGLAGLPLLLVMYLIQRFTGYRISILAYLFVLFYTVIGCIVIYNQLHKARLADQYYDELEDMRYDRLPENIRRYIQYEYALMQYETDRR